MPSTFDAVDLEYQLCTGLSSNQCLRICTARVPRPTRSSFASWSTIHCNHMYADQFIDEPWVVSNGMSSIPEQPGIGVTVNWNTVEKYRIEAKAKPYPHPGLLLRLDWPSGTKSWFTHAQQLWEAFNAGDLPAFMPGVNLTRVADDGSEQWRCLYDQATVSPVHEP